MRMPGFTAEASLYNTSEHYAIHGTFAQADGAVHPALFLLRGCDRTCLFDCVRGCQISCAARPPRERDRCLFDCRRACLNLCGCNGH
jgi:hypothetical protein